MVQSDPDMDGVFAPYLITEDGPGGFGFSDADANVHGVQQGSVDARFGGAGQYARVIMDLDNSLDLALSSFHYASRGNQPALLQVEYFDTNDAFIGMNTYQKGDSPAPGGHPCESNGRGCSIFHVGWMLGTDDYAQAFQEITPTAPFQGVPLGKLIFNSISNDDRDGHTAIPGFHGSFQIDAIQLDPATKTKFNPENHHIINFDVPTPVDPHDGADIEGFSVPGVATFNNLNTVDYTLRLDHGPGHRAAVGANPAGFGPTTSDEPLNGPHQLLVNGDTGGGTTALLEIDIDDSLGGALQSLWLAFRGNGQGDNLVATLEYFDLNNSSLGTETFSSSYDGTEDGDRGLGLGNTPNGYPEYDEVVVGTGGLPGVQNTPMSRVELTYTGGGPSDTYYLDHVVISAGAMACDFNSDSECNDVDIDLLAAAVRNGTSDAKFNVDGIGGDIPDDGDFDFYITDDSMLSTGFGDHDLNMNVNFNDFVKISNNFNMMGGWDQGNGNTDDITNFNDFVRMSNNFGMDFTSASNVPEPATVGAIGLLALIVLRKRR